MNPILTRPDEPQPNIDRCTKKHPKKLAKARAIDMHVGSVLKLVSGIFGIFDACTRPNKRKPVKDPP